LFPKRAPAEARGPERAAPAETPKNVEGVAPGVLEIRAGTIVEASPHPSADKLYVLRVNVGEREPRTVVAGLRPFYAAERLKDHPVALLANLEPRTIRRVTSQGMILAAEAGDRVELLRPPRDVAPGARVAGVPDSVPRLAFAEFEKTPLVVGRVAGPETDGRVRVDVGSGREVTSRGTWATGISVVVRLAPDSNEGEILAFGPDRPLEPAPDLPPGSRVR
jgi:methionine--tRNA ligase beta chain